MSFCSPHQCVLNGKLHLSPHNVKLNALLPQIALAHKPMYDVTEISQYRVKKQKYGAGNKQMSIIDYTPVGQRMRKDVLSKL